MDAFVQTIPKYARLEIERRWLVLLDAVAGLVPERTRVIDDRYITGTDLRLRAVREVGVEPVFKLGKKYQRSAEGQPTVSLYLSEDEFAVVSRLPARTATKRRLVIDGGALDIYETPSHGFAIFEVEFDSANAAASYRPPALAHGCVHASTICNRPCRGR